MNVDTNENGNTNQKLSDNVNDDNSSLFQFVLRPSVYTELDEKIKPGDGSVSNTPGSVRRVPPPVTPRKLGANSQKTENDNSTKMNGSNPFLVRNLSSTTINSLSINNNNHNETLLYDSSSSCDNDVILRGIFNYDGKAVDLELLSNSIRWKPISGDNRHKSKKISPDTSFKLDKFYSVEPLIQKHNTRKSNNQLNDTVINSENLIEGFLLHMFENEKPNIYKPKTMVFNHPHRDTSKEWIAKIKDRLPTLQTTREILVLLNPYSGEKRTRSIFNFEVAPYLNAAQIRYYVIEFHDNMHLKQTLIMNSINFNNYYGIVVISGDGSISKIINLAIEQIAQNDNSINLNDLGDLKSRIKSPFCFISAGTTNMIANTIYGTNDVNTALFHLIYGNSIRIDISSIFTNSDKLHSFGFGFSCGFGTTLARYIKRYSKFGSNKVQTALARGIAKQKHKTIDIEIQYIRNKNHQTCDENLCFRGCKLCGNQEKNLHAKKTVDRVEEFDPIANSIEEIEQNLSTAINYKRKNYSEWEIIRGSFIHVAFLSNSMMWDQSPGGGLSKYAHLGDGCIDLILVDQISRKDFYRFVKRHANHKNQLNLPFVKSIRIKEAKIRILNGDTSFNIGNNAYQEESIYSMNFNNKQNSMQNFFIDNETFIKSPNSKTINHFASSDSQNRATKLIKNYDVNNNFDDDSEDDIENRDLNNSFASASFTNNRIGSFRINDGRTITPNGANFYFIKSIANKKDNSSVNEAFENNENNSPNENPFVQKKNNNSFIRKSQSIMNFFKSDNSSIKKSASLSKSSIYNNKNNGHSNNGNKESVDTNGNDYNHNYTNGNIHDNPLYNTFPGKNITVTTSSLKSASIWNCDWNLNNIPELHIKCNRQFFPVFAFGLDPNTEFEDSAASCLPGF